MQRKNGDYANEPQQKRYIDPNLNETPTEKDLSKRKRNGSFWSALRSFLYDYSENSTIHGVRYIGERQRSWTERIWWAVVLGISIILCCIFIFSSWKKWQESPVIVSFADKSTAIWQIPFPAITLCPETKAKMELLNFTKVYSIYRNNQFVEETEKDNLTDEETYLMKTMYQTCDLTSLDVSSLDLDPQIFANDSFAETLKKLAPDDIFWFCQFNSVPSCYNFVPILTDEGMCYTSNMLNASELYRESALYSKYVYPNHEYVAENWTLEQGYTSDAPIYTYPERALGDGVSSGQFLRLVLSVRDFEYICRGSVQGFKVLLHSPDEIPQMSKHYFRVALNQDVTVSVKPSMFTTSDELKHYDPNIRQCFFNHEPTLKFFKVYNQRNCELECLTLYTLEKCGCVKFSMPREEGTPICGIAKIPCYRRAEYELLQMKIKKDLGKDDTNNTTHCNCLPACTSIVYEAEISSTDLNWKKLLLVDDEEYAQEYASQHQATLSIFFKETQFITSKRSELYGLTDFISACGGLLGLFMGFSILSIVEFIYFCSIRLFCNLRMRSALAPSPVTNLNEQQRDAQGLQLNAISD